MQAAGADVEPGWSSLRRRAAAGGFWMRRYSDDTRLTA